MMCNLQSNRFKENIHLFNIMQYNFGLTAQWRVLLPYHIHIISYSYHVHIHIHIISYSNHYPILYPSIEGLTAHWRLTANGTIPFKDWPTIPLVPQPDLQMWLTVTRATRTRDKTLTRILLH
jgi:hypothetical protein